jgi:DNA-binding transcriptional ArsR family regulator/energy-coupling factor transporter ATP-binding protein EcfA2
VYEDLERDGISLVARREELMARIVDEALHKPGLVEALDQSRSTVDRAIRELESAGFVTRTREGYRTTVVGRLALQRFREFRTDQVTIHAVSDVLSSMPPQPRVPFSLCEHGSMVRFDSVYQSFDRLAADLQSATRYRAVLPSLEDSRQLRLCHALAVDGGLDVELLVDRTRLSALGQEYPILCSELVDRNGLRALEEPPSFALSLVSGFDESPTTRVRVLSRIDGSNVAALRTTDAETIDWAREWYGEYRRDSDTASELIDRTGRSDGLPMPGQGGLPSSLRSEGVVRLDDEYAERHDPMKPATAWRAGLGLPEVQAGYALPRRPTAESTDADWLAGQLIEQLLRSSPVAVIGPPGCGKSTICKRVACDWHDRTGGTVLYRESGRGQPLESIATLQQVLERERRAGPVLVVVEDAVRAEANAVFRLIDRIQALDDVPLLLDARANEWSDPAEFPIDARLEALRRESVTLTHVPSLELAECERLIERVETIANRSLSVDPARILQETREAARETATDGTRARPATISRLFDRLSRELGPESPENESVEERSGPAGDEPIGRIGD